MKIKEILIDDVWVTSKLRNFFVWGIRGKWKEAIEALKKDINNPNYQYIFEPITVVQYSLKSHIRTNIPPFLYRISDGRKRYCLHVLLNLETIKAKIIF